MPAGILTLILRSCAARPPPAALLADGRRRSRRGARAVACLAVLLAGNLDRRFGAACGFFEGDLEVVPQIGAALRPAAAAAAAQQIAEPEDVAQTAENVFEPGEDRRIESAAARGVHALMAEPVVQAALVRVGEHRVGFRAFLECFLGCVVARVAIRVIFHRQLAVRALELDVGGRAADAEDLVVIPLAHAFATFTIAGRSSFWPIVYPRRSSPITSPSRCSGLASWITA